MIEAVLVTILPVGFLIILFLGGALFLQKKISQDGEAPINRTPVLRKQVVDYDPLGGHGFCELGDRVLTRSGTPASCNSLRSRSGVPGSLSCISGDLNWGIPFVSEPQKRTPASKRTGYSG